MAVPICSSCGYADIENHACTGRPSYYNDKEWESLLETRYRVAKRQYQAHLEDEEERIRNEERAEESSKELNELKICEETLIRYLPELSILANSAEKTWSSSLNNKVDIKWKSRNDIKSQFYNLDFDIEEIEEHIENSINSGLKYAEKDDLMFRIFDHYDLFRIPNDKIITLIENFEADIEIESKLICTCSTNPTLHCRLHPSRDFRKQFTGIDGTMGMYNNDDKRIN